jgi:two-component system, cell cycle response regulator
MNSDKLNLIRFKDKQLEEEYLCHNIENSLKFYRPLLPIIGVLFFSFIFADMSQIKDPETIKIILLLRSVFLIISLILFFADKKFLSISKIFLTNTIYEISCLSFYLIIACLYEPYNFLIQYIGLTILILGMFFVVPNSLLTRVILSLIFNILFFLITISITGLQIEYYAVIIFTLLIILLSTFSVFRTEQLERLYFINQKRLNKMSITDPLTGIYNRRKFYQDFKKEIDRAQRYNTELSLIMFDIDNYKVINDKYGHIMGDSVLISITKIVSRMIRKVDIFARLGGDEFIIILPRTDKEEAVYLAERLRQEISNYQFKDIGDVTCSFGVARYSGAQIIDFMNQIDKLLYQAKKNGRNRVAATLDE